jgi:hypothetical protein
MANHVNLLKASIKSCSNLITRCDQLKAIKREIQSHWQARRDVNFVLLEIQDKVLSRDSCSHWLQKIIQMESLALWLEAVWTRNIVSKSKLRSDRGLAVRKMKKTQDTEVDMTPRKTKNHTCIEASQVSVRDQNDLQSDRRLATSWNPRFSCLSKTTKQETFSEVLKAKRFLQTLTRINKKD